MIDYKEGDVVVCIRDIGPCPCCGRLPEIEVRRLYTATRLYTGMLKGWSEELVLVELAEVTPPTGHAINASVFRKAYSPDVDVTLEVPSETPKERVRT